MRELGEYAPEEVVIISTGSQGEPLSALARIAHRNHDRIHIEPGDTVVLASSLIPGNENSVFRVINGLTRLGANVVHKANALVHVSGHASAGELLYCYNILRPRNVMPVHGEVRHLVANAAARPSTPVCPPTGSCWPRTASSSTSIDGVARVSGKVECGYVFVDGSSVGDITETELKDRRILGDEGFITVMVVMDSSTGQARCWPGDPRPRASSRTTRVFDEVRPLIEEALREAVNDGNDDPYQLQQVIRRTTGRWVNQTHRRRPMIIPVVVEA